VIAVTEHELHELVIHVIKYRQLALAADPEAVALDAAHGVAFHRGLGEPITPSTTTPFEQYLNEDALVEFAKGAYAKPNIALISTGPNSAEISKWVSQFFADLPSTTGSGGPYRPTEKTPSKYYGGEQRIGSKAGSALVIAFPGSSAFGAPGYKAEISVLAALLGGESSIKWTPGFSLLAKATHGLGHVHVSTKNLGYSDAGLFTITVTGKASEIGAASKNVVQTLKKVAAGDVAGEDVTKAIALAKFRALEASQVLDSGIEQLGSNILNGAKTGAGGDVAQSYSKVTAKQVQEVCHVKSISSFPLH
jgi:ubiquinol-cytochrome c reductase core subunit 2